MKRETAARALLFDRLVDREPTRPYEPQPFRTLDYDGLLASVQREVQLLLNTHCRFTYEFVHDRERSAYDYGVPDYSNFAPKGTEDRGRLERLLAKTIGAYEPRLHRPKVHVVDVGNREWSLNLWIEGQLKAGDVNEPVSFAAQLYSGDDGENDDG